MELKAIPLESLQEAPLNANRMAPHKFKALVQSIERIGFTVPIVVREGARSAEKTSWEIVDGHHRARAVKEIGAAQTIPAVVIGPDEDPRLASLALNRLRGETDLSIAGMMLDGLIADGVDMIDLGITGFTEAELHELVAALDDPEPSLADVGDAEMPEEIGTPVARPFLLELTFKSKAELAAAKKALKKAAGKGGDLADGLLRLVGAD